ncbi:MAG: hypothetical protein U1F53_13040 [Burkholderiaceae bacterium]
MLLKARFAVLGLFLTLGATSPSWALEKWKLFDNFNGDAIDQDKWPGMIDRAREVRDRQLRLMARDYAVTNSNTGFSAVSQQQSLPKPNLVTEIKAKVTATAVDVVGCAANPQVAMARARIYGTFFNTGAGVSGSSLGDVEAQMRLHRSSDSVDAPGVLRVYAVVARCDDANCVATTELASADFGAADPGQPVGLQMQWDRANKRFLFKRDSDPVVPLVYTVQDAGSAHAPYANVSIRNVIPNCTSAPRPTSMIDALFDDVSINKSAVP